jgi:two-component system, NtrC family, sensor histidine kinase KinB
MQNKTSNTGGDNSRTARTSLELLYHVSREFASALDLTTVLQRVLFLSMKTVGAENGSLIVMDDKGKPVESTIITGTTIHTHTTSRLKLPMEKGLAGWVARQKEAVLIKDTLKDERWISRKYESNDHPETRTVVSAPLLVRDHLIGVLTLSHSIPDFYNTEHLSLVQAIADQAGISVLNARLYAESQRQARVMTALAESAAAINASLRLEEVLTQILEQISQALQVEAVSLAFINPIHGELVFQAATGWRNKEQGAVVALGKGIAGWVALEGQGVVIRDVSKDPRYDPEIKKRTGLEPRAAACAPVRTRGKVIGVLEALNPLEGRFDNDALLVLNGIGSLAGSAIENAQLYESLQAAHQRYLDLFEDSIEPIILTDWEGKIVEANRQAAQAVLLEVEKLQGMSIEQLHDIDKELVGTGFSNLANGEMVSYEAQLIRKDRMLIPVQVYIRKVIIDSKSHLQWIFRDITERKNLDDLREDLLSMVYHDLRSPLSNVVSSLDAVVSILTTEQEPTLLPFIDIARRSAERLQRLTNSLLDINRLEAGQPILQVQPFSPEEIIEDSVEIVLPSANSRQQEVAKILPGKTGKIYGDGDMIQRVLTNLLENAVKFSPNQGKIEVGVHREGDFYKFWVQDNGPGITPEDQERIFEKFTRLLSKDSPKGLGLGLTFCRLAVEAHGGKIWVESETGEFSRFNFTIADLKTKNTPPRQ